MVLQGQSASRRYWGRKGSGAEVSSEQDRMMSETFTNWLTRLQNFTHAGHTHTRARVMFITIMIMIESISPTMRGEGGGFLITIDHGSGQRVREMSGGEYEGGARGRPI